jgi:hypothetical protein
MVTFFAPPLLDRSKAPVENALELTQILDMGPVGFLFSFYCSFFGGGSKTFMH